MSLYYKMGFTPRMEAGRSITYSLPFSAGSRLGCRTIQIDPGTVKLKWDLGGTVFLVILRISFACRKPGWTLCLGLLQDSHK